jgi:hypothetical protein
MREVGASAIAAIALAVAACTPRVAEPWHGPGMSSCALSSGPSRPMIVEWPTPDRAALDARARSGTVVVQAVGCRIVVLEGCTAPGRYGYTATTRKHQTESVRTRDELYAKMPVGAAQLEAKLAASGSLDVAMSVVGTYVTDHGEVARGELTGACADATHVVSSITVGAFELDTVGASATGAAAAAGRVQIGSGGIDAKGATGTGGDVMQ